jgi:dethiobiotin synthetase
MSKGFFITGTDTEVGKTLVSGAVILKLKNAGINAVGFKPVVAGTYPGKNGRLVNEDLETLRIASNLAPDQQNLCPYILDKPAAPHLAGKDQGIELKSVVMMKAFENIQSQYEQVVVEGAGGFLVPLNDHEDLGDIARALDLPVILVVGMRLGCINHALLTLEAIKSRNLTIAGWIGNTLSSEMPFLQENLATIKNRVFAPFLGLIPTLPKEVQKQDQAPYSIEALTFAAQHINPPW